MSSLFSPQIPHIHHCHFSVLLTCSNKRKEVQHPVLFKGDLSSENTVVTKLVDCMQADGPACKLMDLHASLCNCMQVHGPAGKHS